jgi:hypothetical protein
VNSVAHDAVLEPAIEPAAKATAPAPAAVSVIPNTSQRRMCLWPSFVRAAKNARKNLIRTSLRLLLDPSRIKRVLKKSCPPRE